MVDPDNACGAPLMFAKFKVVQNHPRVPGPLNIGKEPYDRSKCYDIVLLEVAKRIENI